MKKEDACGRPLSLSHEPLRRLWATLRGIDNTLPPCYNCKGRREHSKEREWVHHSPASYR